MRDTKRNLNKVITSANNKFFRNKLERSKYNAKFTYKIVNQLLNRSPKVIFPEHRNEKELSEKFSAFFKEKIQTIRNNFNNSTNTSLKISNQFSGNVLSCFEPVSEDEISEIVRSLVNKQSFLDATPCSFF